MKITAQSIWDEYEKCVQYNNSISLDENVKKNENFYIGKI